MGFSVTQRIRQVKQPTGGYVKLTNFESKTLGKGAEALNPEENVKASLIGLAVDYLTRYMSGASKEDAFKISLIGATNVRKERKALKLLSRIKGLDDESIKCAIKLTGYDACYRVGPLAYSPVENIKPDWVTIQNVRSMVERSLCFLRIYGPKVLDGFTFEGGYTDLVSGGDGDFLTKDTLWDFKVSKYALKKENSLQLLMYWRMGLHSIHPEFEDIKYLGIYNPRLNIMSRIAVTDIPEEVIKEVETEIIGYKD